MNAPNTPPPSNESALDEERLPPHLVRRARWLMLTSLAMLLAVTCYLLYARGAFENTQTLILTTDDSEGVGVGMDLTFSGFAIGRVRRVALAEDGSVRISVDVPRKDAHWLRQSSVFTLVRGLVGGTAIRAFTGVLTDPPLPHGAVRPVLRGDATAELPRVVTAARETLENMAALTARDGPLAASLRQVQQTTERLNAPNGALGVLMGNDADARKVVTTIDSSRRVMAQATALLRRLDALAQNADTQVFGQEGLVKDARAISAALVHTLTATQSSLRQLDVVLGHAQAVGGQAREASVDLNRLRNEVEASLRRADGLMAELQRKWPFAANPEIQLP